MLLLFCCTNIWPLHDLSFEKKPIENMKNIFSRRIQKWNDKYEHLARPGCTDEALKVIQYSFASLTFTTDKFWIILVLLQTMVAFQDCESELNVCQAVWRVAAADRWWQVCQTVLWDLHCRGAQYSRKFKIRATCMWQLSFLDFVDYSGRSSLSLNPAEKDQRFDA